MSDTIRELIRGHVGSESAGAVSGRAPAPAEIEVGGDGNRQRVVLESAPERSFRPDPKPQGRKR